MIVTYDKHVLAIAPHYTSIFRIDGCFLNISDYLYFDHDRIFCIHEAVTVILEFVFLDLSFS